MLEIPFKLHAQWWDLIAGANPMGGRGELSCHPGAGVTEVIAAVELVSRLPAAADVVDALVTVAGGGWPSVCTAWVRISLASRFSKAPRMKFMAAPSFGWPGDALCSPLLPSVLPAPLAIPISGCCVSHR